MRLRWALVGFLLALILTLTGCNSDTAYAPVENIALRPSLSTSGAGQYVVQKGDTLYSIAWAYDLDYRTLAQANHLSRPYSIYPGQQLTMTTVQRQDVVKSIAAAPAPSSSVVSSVESQAEDKPVAYKTSRGFWKWPAQGKVSKRFSKARGGNKGIDIIGVYGESVKAASSGVVVYSGAGIRGYGNLIIVKHNNRYLSAYAFNKANLVTIGKTVTAGQVIASMGRDNAGHTMLHFEIRRDGNPVDPLRFLG